MWSKTRVVCRWYQSENNRQILVIFDAVITNIVDQNIGNFHPIKRKKSSRPRNKIKNEVKKTFLINFDVTFFDVNLFKKIS